MHEIDVNSGNRIKKQDKNKMPLKLILKSAAEIANTTPAPIIWWAVRYRFYRSG